MQKKTNKIRKYKLPSQRRNLKREQMRHITFLSVLIILLFSSCQSSTKRNEESIINSEKISILRLDKDIYDYLQVPSKAQETFIKEKYPTLLLAFGSSAMNKNNPETFFDELKKYFSHPMLKQIYASAVSTFDDVSIYEKRLESSKHLIGEHFPNNKLPMFAMHVSGFKENIIVLDSLISISADKYLGKEYPVYKEFFQEYQRNQMQPKFIVRDYLKAWLMSDIIKTPNEDETLLSAMIREGKMLYVLSILNPDMQEADIIGYTDFQLTWCKQYEKDIWNKIINQNHLYTTDYTLIDQYINDNLYTIPIALDSPGRVGRWIGWQIVKQYAEKQNTALSDIINTDPLVILKSSKYNP